MTNFGAPGEPAARPRRLDIALAFFSPAGFAEIVGHVDGVEKIRLLLGAEPPPDAQPPQKRPDENARAVSRGGRLARVDAGLREERDRLPFLRGSRAARRRLIDVLDSGRMERCRYERAILHDKAYLCAEAIGGPSSTAGVTAGSSILLARA